MKISNREKVLLIILGLLIIVFLYYKFLLTPQMSLRTTIEAQEDSKKQELIKLEDNILIMKVKEKKLEALQGEINNNSKRLYVNLIQEDEIRELDRLLSANNIESLSITFKKLKDDSTVANTGENQLENSTLKDEEIKYKTVILAFRGNYGDFLNFVKHAEKNQRIIKLYDLEWTTSNADISEISGTISIDLYITPTLSEEEKKYIN